MQKQQQALQEVGVCTHPTLREPDPLSAYDTGAFDYRLLGRLSASTNRRVERTAIRGNSLAAPPNEWRDLLRGSDTLYRSKAGREKVNRVNAQHSNKVSKSQTLTCE